MSALGPDTIVAVIGAGTMGAGIAQVAAAAGHRVFLHDLDAAAVARAVNQIEASLDRLKDKGRIDAGAHKAIGARIEACTGLDALADAGLAIEAIVEDLGAKRTLFAALERRLSKTAVLASNTSSLSITAIAAGLEHPERVAGMHFFNPAPVMKLVEVVRGAETSAQIVEALCNMAKAWGKVPALASSTPGFIVNRVARSFYIEGLRALAERAADTATVDAVMRECGGFRMGPLELIDLIGVDVNYAVTRSIYEAFFFDPRFRPSLVQQALVDAGHFGRKSGRGFYRYGDGAERPQPQTAARTDPPEYVIAHGSLGPAQQIVDLIDASPVSLRTGSHRDLHALDAEEVFIALTDGRSATQRAAELGKPVVLFDLALDYASAGRIALAPADQCSAAELDKAVGLFQALGKSVSVIDDFPGLLVMRSVVMLANEAADAVLQGVASPGDIDAAMQAGVNYPLGPLAWADRIGLERVVATLDNLRATYGEERYRASAWLRRSLFAERSAAAGRAPGERNSG
jgi:3-hydroxybutyryl-CoA dehydrogenase